MKQNHRRKQVLAELRTQFQGIPHGQKEEFIRIHADSLGISRSAFYRGMKLQAKTCKRAPKIARRDEIVALVARMKYEAANLGKSDRSNSFLRTEFCLLKLIETGEIKGTCEYTPSGWKITSCEISTTTVDTCLRNNGFYKERATFSRHEDPFVNHTHQIDFSPSKYFGKPIRQDNGDYLIQLNRTGFAVYDGKPGDPLERTRLWLYRAKETKSRIQKAQYVVTAGENLGSVVPFLKYAWQDQSHPLHHLPSFIKLDLGSISHSKAFENGLQLLGIGLIKSRSKSNRNKVEQGQGKVERNFRDMWKWEQESVFEMLIGKGIKTILLSDLNELMHQKTIELANRNHPMMPDVLISQYYQTQIVSREQRVCMADLDDYFFTDRDRRADSTGVISVDGYPYMIPQEFAPCKVKIFTNQHGCMVGRKYIADGILGTEEFDILPYDIDSQRGSKTSAPTYREQIMGRTDLKVSLQPENAGQNVRVNPDNIITLKPETTQIDAVTPFTKSVDLPYNTVDRFKSDLIDELGKETWSQVPDTIRTIVDLLAETHPDRLTRKLIQDLSKAVN